MNPRAPAGTRSWAAALLGMALWGCGGGGGTGPSGAPTRILFQYANTGGVFDDSVPVIPGYVLVVRATPVDGEGHPFGSLTQDWSVSGGGTLAHAETAPAGNNDPTLNTWNIGSTSSVQAVTVTLPAYPGVSGTIHVRAVNLEIVRVSPTTEQDLTLGLGQTVALTVRLVTAEGQPFIWPLRFLAGINPSYPCGQAHPDADLGSFSPGGVGASDTLVPDSKGNATVVYTAPTRLSVQGAPPGFECTLDVAAGALASPGGLDVFAFGRWSLHQTAGPAVHIIAESGDGQAASSGATLPNPLQVVVTDAYGNAVAGVPVTRAVTSGGGSLSATNTTSDSSGRTKVTWTVGLAHGTQTVSASISGGISVTFTASVS